MATMFRRFEVYAAGVLGPWWIRDTEAGYRRVEGPFLHRETADAAADRLNKENTL